MGLLPQTWSRPEKPYYHQNLSLQLHRAYVQPVPFVPSLRLEPPPGIIVTQKRILARVPQHIVSFSSIPPFILRLHDVPQETGGEDVRNEIAHGLNERLSVAFKVKVQKRVQCRVQRNPLGSIWVDTAASQVSPRDFRHRSATRAQPPFSSDPKRYSQASSRQLRQRDRCQTRLRSSPRTPVAGEKHDVSDDAHNRTGDDEWCPSLRPLC